MKLNTSSLVLRSTTFPILTGGGLTAAGLVMLLLALIGGSVGVYYAYICLQARPLRPKKHKDAEHGPLIPPDPDVNGNHEDVPLEASAPLGEEVGENEKLHIDEPDSSSPAPQDVASPKPPKEKEDVLISVEDDVPPAKVAHENETAPITSQSAPLGFVVPIPMAASQEAPLDHHPQPINAQPQPEPRSQPQPQPPPPQPQPEPAKTEAPPCSKAPVPVYIPPPQQKKPIAISDEEDGLLLQEPPPQDDSLNNDLCATLPLSHSPQQLAPREESEPTPQNNPPASPPKPEAQPVVVVVPNMMSSAPEKEEAKPLGRAPDPLLSEDCDEPAPLHMKEEDEHLPSAPAISDVNKATDIPTVEPTPTAESPTAQPAPAVESPPTEPAPTTESIPPETQLEEPQDPISKETRVDSDDSLPTDSPQGLSKAAPECVEATEAAKSSPEDDKTKSSPEDAKVDEEPRSPENANVNEDPRAESPCSVSSEEQDPSPAVAEVCAAPVASPESQPQPKEESEEAVTSDAPASPPAAPELPSVSPALNTPEEHLPLATNENLEPNVIVHSSADEEDNVSDISLDASDAGDDDKDVPAEATPTPEPDTHPGKEASAAPSQPPIIVVDPPSAPIESYRVLPDDLSDEDGSPLPVIKEEGSTENISEGTDTESSEPEVTEYSFSSGPSAPSTTGVLANEVSCAMEPKVTKFTPIDDLDPYESEDSEISDEDMEEQDLTTPSDSEEETLSPSMPPESKAVEAEKPPAAAEKDKPVSDDPNLSKQNVSTNVTFDLSTNGAAPSESPASTPDAAADKLPEEEASDSAVSDSESDGAEAEAELKEEMVTIPGMVCNNTNNHVTESPESPSANHTGVPADTCPPKAQSPKTPQGNSDSLEEIPKVTDEGDGLSVSTSESCDLSDGELTTSTPKKSMIPRLVKQSEA